MNKVIVKVYFLFLFAVAISFAARTVLVGSQFVSQGAEIAQLEKQEKLISFQSQQLQQIISQQSATRSITQLALTQGFQPATQIISLQTGFVASR